MIIMDSFLGQHNPSNYFALTIYALWCVYPKNVKVLAILRLLPFCVYALTIIEKEKAAPQPWQAIAQRFCPLGS